MEPEQTMTAERTLDPLFADDLKELLAVSYVVLCNNLVCNRHMEDRFDLPVQAWSSLLAIDAYPGIRAKEIRTLFPRPQNTISRAVSLLERRGLVRPKTSADDGREKPLWVTRRGARLLSEIREVSRRRQEELFGGLTPSERATFLKLATKLANNERLRASAVMSGEMTAK